VDVDGWFVGERGHFVFGFGFAFGVWVCVVGVLGGFWRGLEGGFGEAEGGAEGGFWWEEGAGGDQAEGGVGVGAGEVRADVEVCESLGSGCAWGGDCDGEVVDWEGETNDEGEGRCHRWCRQSDGCRCGQ